MLAAKTRAFKRFVARAGRAFERGGVGALVPLYRQRLAVEERPEWVEPRINTLQVEPTKRCNQRCPMCTQPTLTSAQKGDMSFDQFRTIMDQMPNVTELKLQGLGEVLLNREIWKMFEYAVARHIRVLFATNALLVDGEAAAKLCRLGNIDIRFSIDTLQADRYARIRGVDTFQRATTNVERFAELRRQHGRPLRKGRWAPSAEIRMVCMDENVEELPNMIRYAAEIGIEQVAATFMLSKKHSETQSQFADGKTQTLHSGGAAAVQEAMALAEDLGTVRFKTLPYTSNIMEVCDWPWRMPYITYDGYLTSCCHIENPEAGHFGNIFETPFEELWNGEAYRVFRRNFTDLSKNTNCHVCPFLTEEELAPYVSVSNDPGLSSDNRSATEMTERDSSVTSCS